MQITVPVEAHFSRSKRLAEVGKVLRGRKQKMLGGDPRLVDVGIHLVEVSRRGGVVEYVYSFKGVARASY